MASESAPGPPLAETAVCAPALPGGLEALHNALARFWGAVDAALARPPDGAHRLRLETAVIEVATNIIRHAHPPGAPPGAMRLRLQAHADRIEARFTDRGLAFKASEPAPRPEDEPADPLEIPEGGYGLALVRAAVDEVDYERSDEGTNVWRLVTWLDGPPPA